MTQFYTNIQQYGNKILVREIKNGKKSQRRIDFAPTLFVKSKKEGDSQHHSLYGDKLVPIDFLSINDAKEFVEQYKGVENFPIYGNLSYAYQYITENYLGKLEWDFNELTVLTLDIETASEEGFPDIAAANEEVLLISLQDKRTKHITTFGCQKFDVTQIKYIDSSHGFEYIKCKNEADLLATFIEFFKTVNCDIITGWNTSLFDIPYLVNRIRNVLGPDKVKELSPWKIVNDRRIKINGKDFVTYDIIGINHIDYLDLYRKFTYTMRESYRLDFIADVELGRKKLDLGHETHKNFYTEDWQGFVEYNATDVELVDALEDKMGLIQLIVTMAFDALCNFNDVFSATRLWDCIIYNHLWLKDIIVHQKVAAEDVNSIVGAYVKEPVPGRYNYVGSIDARGLYPSEIMQYNMSPETLVGKVHDLSVDDLLDFKPLEIIGNVAYAANGYGYKRDKQGVFPELVEKIFTERDFYKKKMIQAQREYEKTKNPALKKDVSKYNNIQMARKIQLNSLYGVMANEYFRYYDPRIAEGITLSGQHVIRYVGKVIDEYMNRICETQGIEYAFYSDTDSCYIVFDKLVDKHLKGLEKQKIITLLDKFFEDKLIPHIAASVEKLATYTNAFQSTIIFKREILADTGIWVAKKRYALNVWDAEGVRYETPKLKVMGLEIVRSSTPAAVRNFLREGMKILLTGTEQGVQEFICDVEGQYMKMKPEEIARPMGVQGLDKYDSTAHIFTKGTPMHVRGSLLYNHHIKKKRLTKKYEEIIEGSKIKFMYLVMPNPIGENCIAFTTKLPKELDLHRYVDYVTMFQKTFLDPLDSILKCLKWNSKPVATLDLL